MSNAVDLSRLDTNFVPRNPVLLELLAARARAPEKEGLHSGLSDTAGKFLAKAIVACKANAVIETGLANGFSSLFILDALDQTGGGTLTSLDPFQDSDWQGRGLERISRAGFSSSHKFINAASWQALPHMVATGKNFDLALIDGSHSFDNAFVDFYLIDKMLGRGAILVLDDIGWPAVERVAHYAVTNRDYSIVASMPRQEHTANTAIRLLKQAAARVARTHRTPVEVVQRQLEAVNKASFLILAKTSESRSENKFRQF